MSTLELRGLRKSFGDVEVVKGIDLAVGHAEFVALLGGSGCGKSTTLRMIAGLEDVTGGDILLDGALITSVQPEDRNIAMVFQSYALYPHMTVAENMAFSLRLQGVGRQERRRRATEVAATLGLADLIDRRPGALSGGQRQRVAIGRALVRDPGVFLFDEPLSNLDAKLRNHMRGELKKLRNRIDATMIYVTHDQVEAMTLADRIVVMRDGMVEQIGTPEDVFGRPASAFVAGFIGTPEMNLFEAHIRNGAIIIGDQALPLPERYAHAAEGPVTFGLRPDDLFPNNHGLHRAHGQMHEAVMRIVIEEPLGNESLLVAAFAGHEWTSRMITPTRLGAGTAIPFQLDLARAHLFAAGTGRRLIPADETAA